MSLVSLLGTSSVICILPVVIALLVIWLVKAYWRDVPSNLPPMPEKPLPIFGHMFQLKRNPRGTMAEWRKKAGDIFSYYMGSRLFIVINGYELHKEVFVKHGEHFTDRPDNLFGAGVKDGDRGLANSSGEDWKEQRTVSLAILRSFGMGKNSLADKIEMEVVAYMEELSSLKGEAANIRSLTTCATANIICSITTGRRFDYHDPFLVSILAEFDERIKLWGRAVLLSVYPWLRFIPGDFFYGKRSAALFEKNTADLSDRFILEQLPTVHAEDGHWSFIKAYLREMDERKKQTTHTYLDEPSLRHVVLALFSAGSETSSSTITWYMVYMVNFPHIQEKVFNSIDEVVGTNRLPTMQDKAKLNYLNATIMETQRLASIAPFSIQHKCSKTVTIKGYTIPKGTTIIPNLDSVLWDEKTWGDPKVFRPERFLDADGNLVKREELIPFSLGRRVCLGEALAKMELFLFISCLTQRFEFLPEHEGHPPAMTPGFGIAVPPAPFKIRFRERS